MDASGTVFVSDMVADQDRALLAENDMCICNAFEFFSPVCIEDALVFELEFLHQPVSHGFKDNQVALFCPDSCIDKVRVERNSLVAGDCPRGCCPDDKVIIFIQDAFSVFDLECQINRDVLDIAVDDLGVRNGSLVVRRPVDRLESLEDQSVEGHLFKCPDLACLEVFCQCDIGMLIVSNLAQAFFGGHLCLDLGMSILGALLSEICGRQGFAVNAELLDGVFDRKSVCVPAREERCVEAAHGMGSYDEILDDTVHGCSCMQVSVGVRGTVMKDECLLSFVSSDNLIVMISLFPVFKDTGFLFCQVASHLKIGCWHVERFFVVHNYLPPQNKTSPDLRTSCARYHLSS